MSHQLIAQIFTSMLLQLDSTVKELYEEQKQYLQCKKGCSQCCIDSFKVRYIEAKALEEGIEALPSETVKLIEENLQKTSEERQGKCPLLIDDCCSVYLFRPVLCRAFGLIIQSNNNVGTCELNYNDLQDTKGINIIDIRPYYELLDELSVRAWKADGRTEDLVPNMVIQEYLPWLKNNPDPQA